MSTQPMLPFPGLSVPAKHLEWLRIANAGVYAHKRYWFYPLKNKILHAHAIADGHDVQIIKKKCWCGDGIWRGCDDTLPEHLWQRCRRCSGTGTYETKIVILRRWILNNTVFHEPTGLQPWQVRAKGCIRGLVVHEKVSALDAERAMARLLMRYDSSRWVDYWEARFRGWISTKKIQARVLVLNRFEKVLKSKEEIPF